MRNAVKSFYCFLVLGLFVSAVPVIAADPGDLLFREGSARFERGDYSGAAERYRNFVRRYPKSEYYPEALYRLGISSIKTGDYENGIELLRRLEARYPGGRFRTAFWLGLGYDAAGDLENALASWDRYISSEDTVYRREALVAAAYARAENGDPATAEDLLLSLEGYDRDFFIRRGGLDLLAELYRTAGAYMKITDLAARLEAVPIENLPSGFLLTLGEAHRQQGDLASAEELFRTVIDSGSPDLRASAYGRLFSLYEAAGRLPEMERLVLDAENQLAGDRQALAAFWFRAGAVLSTRGSSTDGIGYLKRAWDVRHQVEPPETLPVFYAQALLAMDDVEGAVEILEDALNEGIGDPQRIRYRLAAAHSRQDDWSAVKELLAPLTSPLDAPAALLLAQAYLRLQEYSEGLAVSSAALESIPPPEWHAGLLKVTWQLQAAAGEYNGAVKTYSQYMRVTGGQDDSVDLQYIRLLFNAGLYNQVARRIPPKDARLEAQLLRGMALIGMEEYGEARETLASLRTAELTSDYRRFRDYYLSWSIYRMGDYSRALQGFRNFRNTYPDSPLASEAAWYGGWSAFSLKNYSAAAELFGACDPSGPRGREALLARARALAADGRRGEALLLAESYLGEYAEQGGDEALYLIFEIHLDSANLDGSSEALSRMEREYPSSPWTSRALFRQAMGNLDAGNYDRAAAGFDAYRRLFPSGEYTEESFFYRAETAAAAGETRLALLLWERLVREYPESSLRPRALALRGEQLTELGEYKDALESYSILLREYPAQAEQLGIRAEISRLESLLVSPGSEYRRLLSKAESAGGTGSREGRALLIRAVQSAIAEGRAEDFNDAGRALRRLLDALPEDRAEQGHIFFVAGEYAFRRNEYSEAASRYLRAASAMPGDQDFTAQALYRSAQMSLYAGDRAAYTAVLDRLRRNFPGSPWIEAAESLGEKR
jgi:TolA-binding protein